MLKTVKYSVGYLAQHLKQPGSLDFHHLIDCQARHGTRIVDTRPEDERYWWQTGCVGPGNRMRELRNNHEHL